MFFLFTRTANFGLYALHPVLDNRITYILIINDYYCKFRRKYCTGRS